MKTEKKSRLGFRQYMFGFLVAIELIISFTFLGYIHVPPISITTAFVPIVVAGCMLGPVESTLLGVVFGLGSMLKATAYYAMPNDMIFSPMGSSNPLGSVLLSVGTRALFGLITGLLFWLARKTKHVRIWDLVVALIVPEIHTFLVYGAMGLFFPEAGFTYKDTFTMTLAVPLIALLSVISVGLADLVFGSKRVKAYATVINEAENNPYFSQSASRGVVAVGICSMGLAIISAFYFSDRTEYMLRQHGIDVSAEITTDLLNLQVQFLIAMLALTFMLLLVLAIVYRYMKYREYRGEMDYLTSVMGRRLFLHQCESVLEEKVKPDNDTGKKGWFLFVDVDYFKKINDTLGHTTGDDVLRQIAACLQQKFGASGAVGRVGGDEFAVFIEQPMTREELSGKLDAFLAGIAGILPDAAVSCSIGVYHFVFPKTVKQLLTQTDAVLYEAKDGGRACYVIYEEL